MIPLNNLIYTYTHLTWSCFLIPTCVIYMSKLLSFSYSRDHFKTIMIPPEINDLIYFFGEKKEVKQLFWVIDVKQTTASVVYSFFSNVCNYPLSLYSLILFFFLSWKYLKPLENNPKKILFAE